MQATMPGKLNSPFLGTLKGGCILQGDHHHTSLTCLVCGGEVSGYNYNYLAECCDSVTTVASTPDLATSAHIGAYTQPALLGNGARNVRESLFSA